MKSVAEYVKEQLTGAFFVLSRSNLGASSDEEFDAAVRDCVLAGGGDGFVVTDYSKICGEPLPLKYQTVSCRRTS